jgi:hypothetical protein
MDADRLNGTAHRHARMLSRVGIPDQAPPSSTHGRDVFRLSSRAKASRHDIDCWHGSPRHPLLGFLTEASAAKILPGRTLGSLGLVGHTHEPALISYDGAAMRAVRPVPGESYDWLATGACLANPGAVCGNQRDAASWWLIVNIDARALRWHRKEFDS